MGLRRVGILLRVRTFALSSARVVMLTATNNLFLVRVVCCLYLCGHVRTHDHTIGRKSARFARRLPPVSIVVYTHRRSRGLHHGLNTILRRSCPRFRIVIVGSNGASRDRSCLAVLRRGCPRLCRDFIPSSSHCVDHGGLTIALKVGTDGCR